jgi:hypothetical protein
MSNPRRSHIYSHTFSNGTKATATLNSNPPDFRVEWSVKPTMEIVPEYTAWRCCVLDEYAKRTHQRILVVDVQ